MKKIFSIVTLALSALTLNAQTQTSMYTPGATTDGIVYFLPKTAIRVSLLIEKSTYTPGDFAQYAERFLRLKDVGTGAEMENRLAMAERIFTRFSSFMELLLKRPKKVKGSMSTS